MGYVFNTDPNDDADNLHARQLAEYNALASSLQTQLDDVCAMYNTATATIMRQAREIRRLKADAVSAELTSVAIIGHAYDRIDDLSIALDAALCRLGE